MIIKKPNLDKFDDLIVAVLITLMFTGFIAVVASVIALHIFLFMVAGWWTLALIPVDIFLFIYIGIKWDFL